MGCIFQSQKRQTYTKSISHISLQTLQLTGLLNREDNYYEVLEMAEHSHS
jgi:hypothetical protein